MKWGGGVGHNRGMREPRDFMYAGDLCLSQANKGAGCRTGINIHSMD